MKEKILKLRAEGKSYKEIQYELNCSKGLIAYYCGDNQREKALSRQRKFRSIKKNILKTKIDFFRSKIRDFKLLDTEDGSCQDNSYNDFYLKIISDPVCYLTGRVIDLEKPRTYQLDHIIPKFKGGSGNIDNMGLTCREANMSKFNMTLEEYLSLCKEVLENFGYSVTKS